MNYALIRFILLSGKAMKRLYVSDSCLEGIGKAYE